MTGKLWLKPSECAHRIGHRDAECIIRAIKAHELPARRRSLTGERVRYLVHVDDFEQWFEQTWKPMQQAS